MTSIADSSVIIQTSSESVPSPPCWLGEVVLLVEHLRKQWVLAAIDEHVRFARRRFGHYEVIDFLAALFGYAISGERTLEAFYERLARNARALGASQVTIKLFGIPQAFALWLGLAVGWGKRDQATFRSEEELAALPLPSPGYSNSLRNPWTYRGCCPHVRFALPVSCRCSSASSWVGGQSDQKMEEDGYCGCFWTVGLAIARPAVAKA